MEIGLSSLDMCRHLSKEVYAFFSERFFRQSIERVFRDRDFLIEEKFAGEKMRHGYHSDLVDELE